MSRLLTIIRRSRSALRRNRAEQWRQAERRVELFKMLDFNLAAGQLAAGW